MLETEEKKKSLAITMGLFLVLFLLLFFFGLSYLDPATEQGIAVNFGTSNNGSGKVQPTKTVKTAPSANITPNKTEVSESKQSQRALSNSAVEEKVVTQNTLEAPVVKTVKKKKKSTESSEKKEISQTKSKPNSEAEKASKPVEKKPDASTQNALDSFLNGAKKEGEAIKGEGNDNTGGDKGNSDGDPKAKSYYGNGKGLDGDGNYRLGGRKALNKERKIPTCNETGIVVVKIVVNQEGKVVQAFPGIKGTTNTAPCLIQPAKAAALATKFNSDPKAPSKQIGSIVYEFKLSE